MSFGRFGDNWEYGSTQLADGAWHFVTITNSGTASGIAAMSMYVDGSQQTLGGSLANNVNDVTGGSIDIGFSARSHDLPFNGLMDSFSMYGAALTAAQVQSLYGGGSISATGGPLPVTTPVQIAAERRLI